MSQEYPTGPSDDAAATGDGLRRRAAAGAGVTLVAHLLGRAATFAFRIVATRVLGAESWGILALAVAVANLSGRFGALGFDRVALRFGAEGHGRRDLAEAGRVWRASLAAAWLGATLLGAAIWICAPALAVYFHQPGLAVPLRALALSIPFIALTNTGAASLQSVQRVAAMAFYALVIPPVVALGVLGGCLLLGLADVTWVAAALAAGWAVAGVGATLATLRASRGSGLPSVGWRIVRFAGTVVLVTGTAQIVWYIDRFMLARMGSASDVGTYDVAATLAQQLAGILAAIAPTFSAMAGSLFFARERSHLLSLYQSATRWSVALTLPMFLALSFAAEPLLAVFGPEFTDARWALVVLAAGQLASTAAGSVGQVLVMTNREGLVFLNNLLVGVLNVVGNWLLIPRYGILGAAVSTSCALAIMNVVAVLELWVIHGLQPFNRNSVRPFAFAVLGGAIGAGFLLTSPGWFGQLAGAVAAVGGYLLLMLRFGMLPEDQAITGPILRKLRGLLRQP